MKTRIWDAAWHLWKPTIGAALVLAALAAGCGDDSTDDVLATQTANEALTAGSATAAEGALLASLFKDLDGTLSPEEVAASMDATSLTPPDCVQTTQDGTSVTVTMDDCSGAFGLVHASGEVTIGFVARRDGMHAHVSSSGLTVNGRPMDLDAEVIYGGHPGESGSIEVTSSGSVAAPRFDEVGWHGTATIAWDMETSCLDLDASWEATVGERFWNVGVDRLHVCAGACPTGTIRLIGERSGFTITVSENGLLTWSSSTGRIRSLTLLCGNGLDWEAVHFTDDGQ